MYFGAVSETIELAKKRGPCKAFIGSPGSKGLLQPDLWDLEIKEYTHIQYSAQDLEFYENSRYTKEQWQKLRNDSIKYGWHNSLLLAQMPTASTAHILGHSESNQPFSNLIYTRTVLSGTYVIVNKYLVEDMNKYNLWTTHTVQHIIKNQGSIATLEIPDASPSTKFILRKLKLKYKTAYEIPHNIINQLSADRGRFICQTQSLNCHLGPLDFEVPISNELSSSDSSLNSSDALNKEEKAKIMASKLATRLHEQYMDCYRKGMKTWSYYVSQQLKVNPINFSVDSVVIPEKKQSLSPIKEHKSLSIRCGSELALIDSLNGQSPNQKTSSSDSLNYEISVSEKNLGEIIYNSREGSHETCLNCAT
jgi:ribonucleotide reductase alpha subunit